MIYEPAEDSFLLEKYVKKFSKNKNVLDVGTGSGIQALSAKKSGAKSVIACDINHEAVKYVNSLGIKAIKSNLLDKISGKFDVIIFNPPYLPRDKREDAESRRVTTGGKRGDELIVKFLKQAKAHLSEFGIILIIVSSLSPIDKIKKTIEKNYKGYEILEKQHIFFEDLEAWLIR
jgi:release factor glutamine methyltransferase